MTNHEALKHSLSMQHDGGREGRLSGNGLLSHGSNFCHTEPYHLFLCVVRLSSLLVTSFYIILWFSWAVVFTPCSSHFLLEFISFITYFLYQHFNLIQFIPCTCMLVYMSSVKTYFDQGWYKLKGKQNKKKQRII